MVQSHGENELRFTATREQLAFSFERHSSRERRRRDAAGSAGETPALLNMREVRSTQRAPKVRGRHAGDAAEGAGEVALVGEAGIERDLVQWGAGGEPLSRIRDAQVAEHSPTVIP